LILILADGFRTEFICQFSGSWHRFSCKFVSPFYRDVIRFPVG
jgi:hypothetical protein